MTRLGLRDPRSRVADHGWLTPRVIDKYKSIWE
jgi:hypothetical protein